MTNDNMSTATIIKVFASDGYAMINISILISDSWKGVGV